MRLKEAEATEFRFELIVKLFEEGKSQTSIAALAQCDQSWVSKVLKRHRTLGAVGLKVKGTAVGNASLLSLESLNSLKLMLIKGALAYDFPTDNWSRERIRRLIESKFGVKYHVSHISKLMRQIGFSLQKPQTRSYRKDDAAVEVWKTETLPALKKSSG